MICPKCAGAMYGVDIEGYKLRRCCRCEGLWFELGVHVDVKAITHSAHYIDCAPPSKGQLYDPKRDYKCPACEGKMVRMIIPEQPHIHVETCEKCAGTFFDAGEFTDYQEFTLSERVKNLMRSWLKK